MGQLDISILGRARYAHLVILYSRGAAGGVLGLPVIPYPKEAATSRGIGRWVTCPGSVSKICQLRTVWSFQNKLTLCNVS